jgi:hypothetical protein
MRPLPQSAPAVRCWSCQQPIGPEDHYCRTCGQGQGAYLPWHYRPFWILVLAFTALGPFVLPLVWRTPRFDRHARWAVTIVVVAITGYVTWELVSTVRELGSLFGDV